MLSHLLSGQATIPLSSTAAAPGVAGRSQAAPQATPSVPPSADRPAATQITLEQAISMALANSPAIKAARTQIQQSQAQEITANLRPNPTLNWDSQFIPVFSPGDFSSDTLNNLQQFDIGVGYLFERGHKRQNRLQAARDATAVTAAQVADTERTLIFNVAQQFINVLLANSTLQFAQEGLKSFQETVNISEQRYRAGDISEGDFLKIKLQLLQFQTDVSSARVAKVQALGSLRQLIGYASLPHAYDVVGKLDYQPLTAALSDLQAKALVERPDLQAAKKGVKAANSQISLAKADAKVDFNASASYSHVSGASSTSLFFNVPLPFFNRNQGEIARTKFALTQAELTARAAEDTVLTDVTNAYESASSNQDVVKLYLSGYLKQAQDSLDISQYAYKGGAATLLDFLDAERSYRSTQLAYRQAVAAYMLSLEQLRQAIGTRSLP
ncbi:MAG TPA: TolC family protein [Candidatus Angelobacter sp.]|jgi:cobalt-zinc-cadmium efflux system outer membrane protein|nr:TolC family protein [Candidatus Angelobacter sp.]